LDRDAILTFLAESGEFLIEPKEILSIDSVPRNDLGKIQRHKLKELLLGLKNRLLAGVTGESAEIGANPLPHGPT